MHISNMEIYYYAYSLVIIACPYCAQFFFQTVWLWQCDKFPKPSDWGYDKIYERMNGLISHLCNCLNQRQLPHYFNETINLLEGFDVAELRQKALYIQNFWENIDFHLHFIFVGN